MKKCLLAAFGLLAGCAIPYLTILKNDFIYTWDDDVYVVENLVLRDWSIENLKTIFTTELGANYHPITYLSLAFEYQLFDGEAWGFHLMSLLFHLACVGLVFWLSYLFFDKNIWAGLISGLVFGLHPMHVESVAWIAERKDVLFLMFLLAGLISYHYYIQKERLGLLLLTCLFAILSMLSKPAAVVFPALLLLMDWWNRRRLSWKLFLEKVPFGLLSLGLIVLTIHFQSQYEALSKIHIYTLSERLVFGSYGWLMYLWKFFAPVSLSGFYPYPPLAEALPFIIRISPLLVVILTGLFIWKGRTIRLLSFAILFFTISLLPVLQIIPVGSSIISERYTYLPYVGLGLLVSGIILFLIKKYPKYLAVITGLTVGLVMLLAFGVWQRCQVWENDFTFWSDVIKKQPLAINGYTYLGAYHQRAGEFDEALKRYEDALHIHPDYLEAQIGKGMILYEKRDFATAIDYFSMALAQLPADPDLLILRGESYMRTGKYEEALADFNRCINLNPSDPFVYNFRAYIYGQRGQFDLARKDLEKAVELGTEDAAAFYSLGTYYYEEGKAQEAIRYLNKAVELAPERERFREVRDSIQTVLELEN